METVKRLFFCHSGHLLKNIPGIWAGKPGNNRCLPPHLIRSGRIRFRMLPSIRFMHPCYFLHKSAISMYNCHSKAPFQ